MSVRAIVLAAAVVALSVTVATAEDLNLNAQQEAELAYRLRMVPRNLWCADGRQLMWLGEMMKMSGPEGTWARQEGYRLLGTPSCTVEQYKQLDELLWRQK